MKIAIVGMGVAGISIIRELNRQFSTEEIADLELFLYTRSDQFGTGFPYRSDDESLLINQYTETMTIEPDDPDDFLNWIKENKSAETVYHSHLPRSWFGEYLKDKMSNWLETLNYTVIYEDVQNIEKLDENTYRIVTEKTSQQVEMVHLAAGHLAYQDPYQLIGTPGYIYDPYPADKQLMMSVEQKKIALIGTGLTALDALLFLRKEYPLSEITFYSRDGLFSSVRGNESSVTMHYFCQDKVSDLIAGGKQITLSLVKDWFLKEMDEHGINTEWIWKNLGKGTMRGMAMDLTYTESLGEFQSLIRHMRKCYPIIWINLPDEEKDEFIQTYGKQWQRFKAPLPQKTATYLIKHLYKEDIKVVKDLKKITKKNSEFELETEQGDVSHADVVVNCTGQDTDLKRSLSLQQPLIRNLVSSSIIVPYQYGGIQIDYPSMSVIDASGNCLQRFKAYGQIVSGVQFGNNNVELVSMSAASGVNSMKLCLQKKADT